MPHRTEDAFGASRARFDEVCSFMGGEGAMGLTHGELEARLSVDVRELVRQLLQDHLDLRAAREERLCEVVDDKGVSRGAVEAGHIVRCRRSSAPSPSPDSRTVAEARRTSIQPTRR